ncbi:phosphoenolpyruvate carboxylase family protein [Actinidia rufa]|uniref:Phosphoenolpyruvate carboxylase family protein n=1 Tax=Actinidia rufa TaxID=165716 RepID=A0A7J0DL58_9ERIC|nr:phosphoenolpyruvate carboxylase family protein [Actinidia rufa]
MSIIMAGNVASLHYPSSRMGSMVRKTSIYPTASMETRIHRLIKDHGTVLIPGCYDALSAAILEKTGFKAGFISGYSLSASLLAKPDLGFLTTPEIAAAARFVCAAAPHIPIMVDADNGGGNALNVKRTVEDLIGAGAAGCFLEVIPADEHATKIAAAREAIGNSDFFLVARTEARATSEKYGLSEAISRANLYLEAGADACFVGAPRSDDELIEIGRKVEGFKVCTMLEGGVTPLHTPDELRAMGFHLAIHPLTSLFASTRAMVDILKTLKDHGTTRDHLKRLTSFDEFHELVNLETWFELEARTYTFNEKQIELVDAAN